MDDVWNWYPIFKLTDWLATGLVQRTLVLDLQDMGEQSFLITQGETTAVLWEDKFLPVNFLDQNPYIQDGVGVFKDTNDNVYIGFKEE